jgi:hypothetical protein
MSSDSNASQKNVTVVQDAIRIATILNKHLSEENCRHSVKQIASEAFEYNESKMSVAYKTTDPKDAINTHFWTNKNGYREVSS